jgi:hypothetical protein
MVWLVSVLPVSSLRCVVSAVGAKFISADIATSNIQVGVQLRSQSLWGGMGLVKSEVLFFVMAYTVTIHRPTAY